MAKRHSYSAAEAWAIFVGGFIIGIVLTSFFWAYITIPEEVRNLDEETIEELGPMELTKPVEFINFCNGIKGTPEWDSSGYRKCVMDSTDEQDVIVMSVVCRKFDLNLSYGSYGVACEGYDRGQSAEE